MDGEYFLTGFFFGVCGGDFTLGHDFTELFT